MSLQNLGGVINPYALTEALLGKRIDWRKIDQPLALVENTLSTSAENLFDAGKGSVLFSLQRAVQQKNGLLATARSAGSNKAERIKALLDTPAQINPALRDRLADILIPADPDKKETEYANASWRDLGDFFEEGTEFGDPVQGAIGDCWLIAALASVAWSRPYAIAHRNRASGQNNDQFLDAIEFANTPGNTQMFEVTENVPVNNATNLPIYARSSESGEMWPGIYEKAYAKLRSGNETDKPDIRTLHGGDCVDASVKLVPGLTGQYIGTAAQTADSLWNTLQANCIGNPATISPTPLIRKVRAGRTVSPLTAWTYAKAADAPDTIAYDHTTGIVGWHCYSVLGWITVTTQGLSSHPTPAGLPVFGSTTKRYIVLRNPWGQHEGLVDILTGDWLTHDRSWWRSTPLNTGGLFAMTIESFKKYYAGLGIAK